ESLLREPSAHESEFEFEPSESLWAGESARSFEPESFEATLSDEVSLSSEVSPRAAEAESEQLFDSAPLSARVPPALLFAELVESPSGSEFAVPPAADPSLSSVSESEPPEALLFALSLRSGYFSPLAMMVCPSEVKVHLGLGPPSGK